MDVEYLTMLNEYHFNACWNKCDLWGMLWGLFFPPRSLILFWCIFYWIFVYLIRCFWLFSILFLEYFTLFFVLFFFKKGRLDFKDLLHVLDIMNLHCNNVHTCKNTFVWRTIVFRHRKCCLMQTRVLKLFCCLNDYGCVCCKPMGNNPCKLTGVVCFD